MRTASSPLLLLSSNLTLCYFFIHYVGVLCVRAAGRVRFDSPMTLLQTAAWPPDGGQSLLARSFKQQSKYNSAASGDNSSRTLASYDDNVMSSDQITTDVVPLAKQGVFRYKFLLLA